jgi:hypothetical protein
MKFRRQGHQDPVLVAVSAALRCRGRSSTARVACRCTRCAPNVDYGFYEAKTTFGRIGVKVWIYKGDVAGTSPRSVPRTLRPVPVSARPVVPCAADRPARGAVVVVATRGEPWRPHRCRSGSRLLAPRLPQGRRSRRGSG